MKILIVSSEPTFLNPVTAPSIDIEIPDPMLIPDFEKRSAPNTDIEIPDPGALNNANPKTQLTDIEKRGAPNTDFEITDPPSVTRPADFEKRSAQNA